MKLLKKIRKRVMFELEKEISSRNVSVLKDVLGHNVVVINDIMNIKKKRVTFSSPKTLLSKKPIS